MDETRTIVITTHQVEEVENLLTDVLFIDKGRIVLDCSVEDIGARYAAVEVLDDRIAAARAERPFYERRALGKTLLYFEGADRQKLEGLGEIGVPSVADLFVAKVSAERAP
jgi:ABC-2 type transport system ATP-binding protein